MKQFIPIIVLGILISSKFFELGKRFRKGFRIFVSHSVDDFKRYRVDDLARFLESQKEVGRVFYCETDLIGNIDQWILIRGSDKRNPILLFLHGGPGAPLFTYAREIGVGAHLEKYFVMVYWEQRGTGKSYNLAIPPKSMSIEQLVSDMECRQRLDSPS